MLHRLVDTTIQDAGGAKLQHLRRFIKPAHLPTSLGRIEEAPEFSDLAIEPARSSVLPWSDSEGVLNRCHSAAVDKVNGTADISQPPVLHYLVCPTSVISIKGLHNVFSSEESSLGIDFEPHLRTIPVPLNAPSSEKQARNWSRQYWPTVYKGGNPYGPHPALVSRALEDVHSRVEKCMDLAKRVGKEALLLSKGEPIGAVIVDRGGGEATSVVVVAGDARWHDVDKVEQSEDVNVTAHAIMRAIGMVARKRRALLHRAIPDENIHEESNHDTDRPLTPLEKDIYATSIIEGDGYLCLDLELYITHEPCVMCSMALLHSRFSRVIFEQRMPCTGGLTAVSPNKRDSYTKTSDRGLGYGLSWRQELNWRHLAWQWVASNDWQATTSSQDVHV